MRHLELAEFLQARLKALLVAEWHPNDLVEAVIATSGMDLVHDAERVRALLSAAGFTDFFSREDLAGIARVSGGMWTQS